MSRERRSLLDLIGSVADGARVDWQEELRQEPDPMRRDLLQSLHIVKAMGGMQERAARPSVLPPGRYSYLEVRELLASGAHADVYRAYDHRLHRDVALKVLMPDAGRWRAGASQDQEAFLDEARRLARVKHPNVAVLYGLETIDGRPALVVEYLPGSTLAELVRRDGPFGASEVAALGAQLCAALAAVHAAGLVHQDVKAQNVMRETGGRVVLMDFGSGGVTPMYMAPELFEGAAPTPASDLYALGVLLFYLATGEYPVRAESLDALREAHAAVRRRRLLDLRPDLPGWLAATIDRAVAPISSGRFATAGELAQALAPATAAPLRARASWKRPALIAAGLLSLILVSALVWRARTPREAEVPLSIAVPATADDAFSIEAAFYRGDRQRERLFEGAPVSVGDSISLSLVSSDSIHVYVLNQDDTGAAYVLFPAPRFAPQNPLAPGIELRLPGQLDGQPFYWQITSDAEQEQLLILASRRRLRALEGDLLQLARPEQDAPLQFRRVPDDFLDELRGMGGYAAASSADAASVPASTAQLLELAQPLRDGRESAQGVWIRRLTLFHAR